MNLQIENSDKITSLFGYWPEFCDAKLHVFTFKENKDGSKSIRMCLFYLDSDQSLDAEIEIFFNRVSQVEINSIFDENILDKLIISKVTNKNDLNYMVELEGCYGISGTFSCEGIEVNNNKGVPSRFLSK